MMMIAYLLPIDRLAVQSFCKRIIVSYLHISLHVLPTLPCILIRLLHSFSSMSCHAPLSTTIIERSDGGVTDG
jgi:hypothetical protein